MGRPKKYLTAEEKKAARLETYKRYNAKRYAKVDTSDFMEVPGVKIKQTKTKTYFISTDTGKNISANKITKLIPNLSNKKQVRKTEVVQLMIKRAKQQEKRLKWEVRTGRKTQRDADLELLNARGKSLKDAARIHRNRIAGTKLAVRSIVEYSNLFTDAQKELLYKHADSFFKVAPEGERANFWEAYNEVTSGGLYGTQGYIETDAGVLKLREMFEAQFGEAYTKTFLKFLY